LRVEGEIGIERSYGIKGGGERIGQE